MRSKSALVALLTLILLLGGCTTTTLEQATVVGPRPQSTTIAIGDVLVSDELWQSYALHVRRGLTDQLAKSQAFSQIINPAPNPIPIGSIVLTGHLTEADKGSMAARFIIGFGAGRARAAASFRIADNQGAVLAEFVERKAYSGGVGIGGLNMLDMEDLMYKLGQEAAETVAAWAQTGKLQMQP